MKIKFAVIAVLAAILFSGCTKTQEPIPTTKNSVRAVVDEITADCAVLIDIVGECWVWELKDGDKFAEGDTVTIVFDTLGTDDIYDDEIISID